MGPVWKILTDNWDIILMYPVLFAAAVFIGWLSGWAVIRVVYNQRLAHQADMITNLRAVLEEKLPASFLPPIKRNRGMSFPLILAGLGLAFVGIAIAIGGAVWQMRTTQADNPTAPLKMVGAAQPHTVTAPASPPRITTAPADVPKKLAAIDALRQILNGDMATWINKGQQLTTGAWWNWAVGGETAQLRKDVTAFREKGRELNEKLEHLQKDNLQFPDIHALATSPLGTPFLLKMEKFVTSVLALPDDAVKVMGNNLYRTVFEPYAKEAYETINEVDNWRGTTDRNALQLRQQISQ
jgi:hypothetical protein